MPLINAVNKRVLEALQKPTKIQNSEWGLQTRFKNIRNFLMLAIVSTVVLGFGPLPDPWHNLCSFQDRLCVWKWDLLFDERRDLSFWVGTTFVASQFHTSVPALAQRPGKGICNLWTPYTLCHFTTMNNNYAKYTQNICQCRRLQQIMP
jgi:hypothetical protein